MAPILLAGLLRVELPGHTIRLCDGGFVRCGGEIYRSADPVFGSIAGFEQLSEGVGDELPAGRITLLPAAAAAASVLSRPAYQNARVAMWIVEVDRRTGRPIGAGDQQVEAQVDRTVLRLGRSRRALDIEFTPRAERLFLANEGNTLSPTFHRQIWPDEAGLDNATGLVVERAWGVASSPRGLG